ncbi:unnamed protein product [Closterium sp. NIES-54]
MCQRRVVMERAETYPPRQWCSLAADLSHDPCLVVLQPVTNFLLHLLYSSAQAYRCGTLPPHPHRPKGRDCPPPPPPQAPDRHPGPVPHPHPPPRPRPHRFGGQLLLRLHPPLLSPSFRDQP